MLLSASSVEILRTTCLGSYSNCYHPGQLQSSTHLFLFAFPTFELGKKEKERETEKEGRQEGRREGEGKEAEVFYDNRKHRLQISVSINKMSLEQDTFICMLSCTDLLLQQQTWAWQRSHDPHSLKYLLPSPLQAQHWGWQTPSSNNTREDFTWTSPDGQHWNQIDCILAAKDGEALYSHAKTRPGADCGSEHELLIAKFRLIQNRPLVFSMSAIFPLTFIRFCNYVVSLLSYLFPQY